MSFAITITDPTLIRRASDLAQRCLDADDTYNRLIWVGKDDETIVEANLAGHFGTGNLLLVGAGGRGQYLYFPKSAAGSTTGSATGSATGSDTGDNMAAAFAEGALKRDLPLRIEIVDDDELQALASTRDEWALRGKADVLYELDVNDCDDVVGTFDDGLDSGVALANRVLLDGSPDCKIFKILLSQYVGGDVLTFWVGTHDDVKERLEGLPKAKD